MFKKIFWDFLTIGKRWEIATDNFRKCIKKFENIQICQKGGLFFNTFFVFFHTKFFNTFFAFFNTKFFGQFLCVKKIVDKKFRVKKIWF